jgi:hypothetical protein
MKEVRDATAKILESTTLGSVCRRVEEARKKTSEVLQFQI